MLRFSMSRLIGAFLAFLYICIANAQWVQTTGPEGGSVNRLATNGTAICAITEFAVFVSQDSGATWIRSDSGFAENPTFKCVGSNGSDFFVSDFYHGLYKSTDNGMSWFSTPGPSYIDYMTTTNDGIFAATSSGSIYRSTTNGSSWISVNNGLVAQSGFFFIKGISEKVYVAPSSGGVEGTLFVSENAGNTWQNISQPSPVLQVFALCGTGSALFAAGTNGVYRSTNQGISWTKKNTGFLPSDYAMELAIKGSVLFAGTSRSVYKSVNNGDSWTAVFNDINIKDMLVVGNTLFIATVGGGVYKTNNEGATWIECNTNLIGTYPTSMLTSGDSLFASTSANGVFKTTDQGNSWVKMKSGLPDGTTIYSMAFLGSRLFAGGYPNKYPSSQTMFLWSDSGNTWLPRINGLVNKQVSALIVRDSALLIGTNGGVYKSLDSGNHWNPLGNATLSQMVYSLLSVGNKIFAGTLNNGIYRSEDNGNSWVSSSSGITASVTAILTDGVNLYAVTSNKLYKSTNGGQSWMPIVSPSFPQAYGLTLMVNGQALYAGCNTGVYASYNGGDSWFPVNPNFTVKTKKVVSMGMLGDNLFAGVAGGGVFKYDTISATRVVDKMVPEMALFPNPADEMFYVTSTSPIHSISLTDAIGRVVETKHANPQVDHGLNIAHLTPGLYTVRVQTAEGVRVQKLVKR